jgi:hypothetical protein
LKRRVKIVRASRRAPRTSQCRVELVLRWRTGSRSVLGWKRPRPIRWFLQPELAPEPHAQGRGMEHFVGIDVARDRLDRGLCGRAVSLCRRARAAKVRRCWGSGPETPRCRIDRVLEHRCTGRHLRTAPSQGAQMSPAVYSVAVVYRSGALGCAERVAINLNQTADLRPRDQFAYLTSQPYEDTSLSLSLSCGAA